MKLSAHFDLKEFLPEGKDEAPGSVLENLLDLCVTLLEPAREGLGFGIRIGSGWRPGDVNAKAGGAQTSDHLTGSAADCQATDTASPWEENTFELFDWLRVNRFGKFGQLILEDHREALENPRKLWVHVSLPTPKHPGTGDASAILVSTEPRSYRPWTTAGLA